jgi:peptidoglycan/xylan/chitin deacetylase (PgdA/CDA1 family)
MTRFSAAVVIAAITGLSVSSLTLRCSSLAAPQQNVRHSSTPEATPAPESPAVSILVYHRFGPTVKDGMTVRTATFRWQLDYLREHDYSIIPLRGLISHLLGDAPAPPPRSVVITADDGHESVFTEMLPIVREFRVPVTLFIYPSAISNASYAMTWPQLEALHRTGLFDIESHTYWHPNFKTEKKRLSPTAYRAFATMQLMKSRDVLRDKLQVDADLIAWPFGIYDDELIAMAREAGYTAGFTIERRVVTDREPMMALPRFLVTDSASGSRFTAMLPKETR